MTKVALRSRSLYLLLCWPLLLALVWSYFWAVDLRQAKTQWLLALVPCAAIVTACLGWLWQRRAKGGLWLAMALTMTVIWGVQAGLQSAWLHHFRWERWPLGLLWLWGGVCVLWFGVRAEYVSRAWRQGAYIGAWGAWGVVLWFFVQRADNGCTGVSSVYTSTLWLSLVLWEGWIVQSLWMLSRQRHS